jgi:hypothetical protein
MTYSLSSLLPRRRSVTALAALLIWGAATTAFAGPHRARLSKDLADHLASASSASVDVIVDGTADEIQSLAVRYGAKVKKPLKNGAVLEVTGAQLDAMSQDPEVSHISGDVKVHRMMAVTAHLLEPTRCGPARAICPDSMAEA